MQVQLSRSPLRIRNGTEGGWRQFLHLSDWRWRFFSGKGKLLLEWCRTVFPTKKAENHVEQLAEFCLGLDCDWWWSLVLYLLLLRVCPVNPCGQQLHPFSFPELVRRSRKPLWFLSQPFRLSFSFFFFSPAVKLIGHEGTVLLCF